MSNNKVKRGFAFVFEGETEEIFYKRLIEYLADKNQVEGFDYDYDGGEENYLLEKNGVAHLVKFNTVGSISKLLNSLHWIKNNCLNIDHINWTIFLCYDTDSYLNDVSQFYEGDWEIFRDNLDAFAEMVDLAASADIEDVMLLDYDGLCKYLSQASIIIPDKDKGKYKMKQIFRDYGNGKYYHEGQRAAGLIASLNFEIIMNSSTIPFKKMEKLLFSFD